MKDKSDVTRRKKMVISSNFWPKNIFDEIWPKVDKKYFVIWPQNIKILCYLTKKICRKSIVGHQTTQNERVYTLVELCFDRSFLLFILLFIFSIFSVFQNWRNPKENFSKNFQKITFNALTGYWILFFWSRESANPVIAHL